MTRSTALWSSDNPDAKIPPRVRLRVFDRANGCCEVCGRRLGPGDKWQADHVVALVNNGAHSEANLRCICDWCHKGKTAEDVAEKSITARKRAKHILPRAPSRMRGPGFHKSEPQRTASKPSTKFNLIRRDL